MSIHELIDKELAKERKVFEKDIRDLYLACERAEGVSTALRKKAQTLVDRLNGNANGVMQATASKPKAKRAAVSVTYDERALVSQFLSDRPFSIKEIARAALAGRTRTTAEALRQLAAEGKAVEGPRGKWRKPETVAVAAPAAEDGVSA